MMIKLKNLNKKKIQHKQLEPEKSLMKNKILPCMINITHIKDKEKMKFKNHFTGAFLYDAVLLLFSGKIIFSNSIHR